MSPEVVTLLGKVIDGVLSPAFLASAASAYFGWRSGAKSDAATAKVNIVDAKVQDIKDGMKSALATAEAKKGDAEVAQAKAEGKEAGRLIGESEAAARK